MATRKITLKGTCSWPKIFEGTRDLIGYKPNPSEQGTYEACDGAYTIDVTLDRANFDKLKTAGSIKTGTVVEDGVKVKFVRKHKDRFEWSSGAPKVTNDKGVAWDPSSDPVIGNGTIVSVDLSVYDTSFGKCGTRLDAVKVLKLTEYLPDGEATVSEDEMESEGIPF